MAAASMTAAVFLAYTHLTEANAVQDVRIEIHDKALITLKGDLVDRLDRIEDQINEIRKNQERNR